MADEVLVEQETGLDNAILKWTEGLSTPGVLRFMESFTFLGSTYFLLPAYCVLMVMCFVKKRNRLAIDIGIVGLTSTILLKGLKYYFERTRPDNQLISPLQTFSFPSGHALSSFIFCSSLVYILWKSGFPTRLKWLLSIVVICIALIIGISRIFLRVHYPSDVIAGVALAIMWVLLSFWLLARFR